MKIFPVSNESENLKITDKTLQRNYASGVFYVDEWFLRKNLRILFGFPLKDQRIHANLFDWALLSPRQQDHRQEARLSFTGACCQQCIHSAGSDSPISVCVCTHLLACLH